jgi:hypothetical protein
LVKFVRAQDKTRKGRTSGSYRNDGSLEASYETTCFHPFDTVRDAMSFPEAGGEDQDIGRRVRSVNQ